MIDKYYNGVIDQVYERVGKVANNVIMARYSNDFSIRDLESIRRYSSGGDEVYFTWKEYDYDSYIGAYDPFLDIICDMHRRYAKDSFAQFMDDCNVYYLHRFLLQSYYDTGVCVRQESLLLDEVEFEQNRLTEAMAAMLGSLSRIHPVMIVLNRFQMASYSTMVLVKKLLDYPDAQISLVLGANESRSEKDCCTAVWDEITEKLADNNHLYHIGSSGIHRNEYYGETPLETDHETQLQLFGNMIGLLDFNQARKYFQNIEFRMKFEDMRVPTEARIRIYLMYAWTCVYLGELMKAHELVEDVRYSYATRRNSEFAYECAFLKATCYMYQGKLDKAENYAGIAAQEAGKAGNEEQLFKAELLALQTRMSGWYNIFFCVSNIPVKPELIEQMKQYNYQNHLAHVYIYAYDNEAKVLAQAGRSEEQLTYFSRGVELARQIGNSNLISNAYQKNAMLASTNGMNDIAMIYSLRSYHYMKHENILADGRSFSGTGYNLGAMGDPATAEKYYNYALQLLYQIREPVDIAEVYYNRALNNVMQMHFEAAERDLQIVMKVIEHLHLNSLRVCNLSKLYGLMALVYIMQDDKFNCERYLLSCRQFLNYVLEKEKNKNEEIIHDYAKCDDDIFLYAFSNALLHFLNEEYDEAEENFRQAESVIHDAEGNLFFVLELYHRIRRNFYHERGQEELCRQEEEILEEYIRKTETKRTRIPYEMLSDMEEEIRTLQKGVREEDIDMMIKQYGLEQDYISIKDQMDFISSWQKLLDVNDTNVHAMVENAMHTFLNYFSNDRALYVIYQDGKSDVLYNDTGVGMTEELLNRLKNIIRDYPQGFVVSKASDSFEEHLDIISIFGEDDVCSFVAIPFFHNGELTNFVITYVQMRDNWHSSIERFMLNEEDLNFYATLFREMNQSISRMETRREINEMNQKLHKSAVTDPLTGIYNRAGMFEEIHNMVADAGAPNIGLMMIDLDNFKYYNDTYGHDIGDLMLKKMSGIFTEVTGNRGFVSRYGGDEFIVIFHTANPEELERIAQEIYRRVYEANGFRKDIMEFLGKDIVMDESRKITCSMGIVAETGVSSEEEFDRLISQADDLMYTVKTSGKGRYEFL